MKKILLGTSVAALALTLTPANAANFEMNVRGFFTSGIGLLSDGVAAADPNAGRDQPVVLVADSEVHFDPRLTLDNGLQFGADIEFEANNPSGGQNVDEYSMFVSGSFGKVEIGAQDGAGDAFGGGLPCPTFTCSDDGFFDRTGFSSLGVDGADSSDAIKISYFSPSFAGFQAGVSYIPDDDSEGATITGDNDDNSVEVGAKYSNSFGDISVNIGASYFYDGGENGVDSRTGTAIGETNNFGFTGAVGFGGFTFGGGFESNGDSDFQAWGVGLTYDTGPWNFGAHFADVITDDQSLNDGEDEWNGGIGASYEIAAGVTAGATFEFGENPDQSSDTEYAGGLFMGLSF